jgi:sulfoquinovosidase
VYFPKGAEWVDLWTGADAGTSGEWVKMPAAMGMPAVFLRKGAVSASEILGGLKGAGVL